MGKKGHKTQTYIRIEKHITMLKTRKKNLNCPNIYTSYSTMDCPNLAALRQQQKID